MLRTIGSVPLAHREPAAHHSRSAAAVWLLAAALVAVGACGTVDAAPTAKDDAGGNGAAGAGGASGGAGGAVGEIGGAGAAGHAGASGSAGTTGGAGEGGRGGASSAGPGGGTGSAGAGGSPGVSDVPCPYDVTVQRGCPGVIVSGSPCDVCKDGSGALLRCSTDPRAGARMYCVADCSQCY